jgi:tetratricopeptide (TPR) repeat protein
MAVIRAGALADLALFSMNRGDYDEWARLSEQAAACARAAGMDPPPRALALHALVLGFQGEHARAVALGDKALRFAEQSTDVWEWAYAASCLVNVLSLAGRLDEALALSDVNLQRCRALGNPTRLAVALYEHGVAVATTDVETAISLIEEAAEICEHVGNRSFGRVALANSPLSAIVTRGANPVRAARWLRRTLRFDADNGLLMWVGWDLRNIALVAFDHGEPRTAAMLLAASELLRASYPVQYLYADNTEPEREHRARSTLYAEYPDAWAEGPRLARAEAVSLAFDVLDRIETGDNSSAEDIAANFVPSPTASPPEATSAH